MITKCPGRRHGGRRRGRLPLGRRPEQRGGGRRARPRPARRPEGDGPGTDAAALAPHAHGGGDEPPRRPRRHPQRAARRPGRPLTATRRRAAAG